MPNREKFRIRLYNGSKNLIRLEKKSKSYGLCTKQSAELDAEQAALILDGCIGWMRDSPDPLITELYSKMNYQRLKPRTIVDYQREAYVYPYGNVRVTFDSDIRTGLYGAGLFERELQTLSVSEPGVLLLEVKYDNFLPDIIYYLYENDGQLTILPWDYNLSFGGFQSGSASSIVNFPIDTPVSGVSMEDRPLLGKLLEVPEYLELYHGYLRQITDGYFNSGLFEQTIASLDTLIAGHVENDPTAFYDYTGYQTAVSELIKPGLLRSESITGQLDGIIPSTSAGQSADGSTLIDASGVNLSALGSMGGGMGGNRQGGFGGADSPQGGFGGGGNAARQQGGGIAGQRPTDMQDGAGITANRMPGFGNQPSVIASGFDANTWLLIGFCVILLSAGLLFVIFFRRRSS